LIDFFSFLSFDCLVNLFVVVIIYGSMVERPKYI